MTILTVVAFVEIIGIALVCRWVIASLKKREAKDQARQARRNKPQMTPEEQHAYEAWSQCC